MRIRSFFWFLPILTCMSMSFFVLLYHPRVAVLVQVHGDIYHFVAQKPALLDLVVTDKEGQPIEHRLRPQQQ